MLMDIERSIWNNYLYLWFCFSAQEEEKGARKSTETERIGENKLNLFFFNFHEQYENENYFIKAFSWFCVIVLILLL